MRTNIQDKQENPLAVYCKRVCLTFARRFCYTLWRSLKIDEVTIINMSVESVRIPPPGYNVGTLGHLLVDVHKLQVDWRVMRGEVEVHASMETVKKILEEKSEFRKLASALVEKQ